MSRAEGAGVLSWAVVMQFIPAPSVNQLPNMARDCTHKQRELSNISLPVMTKWGDQAVAGFFSSKERHSVRIFATSC